jgi:hypothetical protein
MPVAKIYACLHFKTEKLFRTESLMKSSGYQLCVHIDPAQDPALNYINWVYL